MAQIIVSLNYSRLRAHHQIAMPTKLHVILGKSPGQTLNKMGKKAYSLQAQKEDCKRTFNRRFGKKWRVAAWYVRDISARRDARWSCRLAQIIAATQADNGILATSTVCRMLRNKQDLIQIEESKVPVLICENEELDTTTPRGKNIFGKLVLDAELEAGLRCPCKILAQNQRVTCLIIR